MARMPIGFSNLVIASAMRARSALDSSLRNHTPSTYRMRRSTTTPAKASKTSGDPRVTGNAHCASRLSNRRGQIYSGFQTLTVFRPWSFAA